MIRKSAFPTSVVLAASTFGIFWAAQSLGPETAIRRFVQSVALNDLQSAQQHVRQSMESGTGGFVIMQARQTAAKGGFDVVDKKMYGNSAVIVTSPIGESRFDAWVVVRVRGQWVIDADRTYILYSQGMFLGQQ